MGQLLHFRDAWRWLVHPQPQYPKPKNKPDHLAFRVQKLG
jgi:hypothetical protein